MSVWSSFFSLGGFWPESWFSFSPLSGFDYKAGIGMESVKFWIQMWKCCERLLEGKSLRSGVPTLQTMDWDWSRPVRNRAIQQEVSLNVMLLNHPETIPHPVHGKIVLHKNQPLVPKRWGTVDLDYLAHPIGELNMRTACPFLIPTPHCKHL